MSTKIKTQKTKMVACVERFKSNLHSEMAKRLSSHHYGADEPTILSILSKLTEGEVNTLFYNIYRTSEKIGTSALFPESNPWNQSDEEEF